MTKHRRDLLGSCPLDKSADDSRDDDPHAWGVYPREVSRLSRWPCIDENRGLDGRKRCVDKRDQLGGAKQQDEDQNEGTPGLDALGNADAELLLLIRCDAVLLWHWLVPHRDGKGDGYGHRAARADDVWKLRTDKGRDQKVRYREGQRRDERDGKDALEGLEALAYHEDHEEGREKHEQGLNQRRIGREQY